MKEIYFLFLKDNYAENVRSDSFVNYSRKNARVISAKFCLRMKAK